MVIDGESRLAAARQLGLASVPCIRVDHLNESEQRLLRLAVNRLYRGTGGGIQGAHHR
jgi:ParB-like chromosome segregation protein Spo0J